MGFGVWGLGFRISDSRFRVLGCGTNASGSEAGSYLRLIDFESTHAVDHIPREAERKQLRD